MQFRLSTFLLAIVVFSTSLSLMGPWGIPCTGYVLLLARLFRACRGSRGGLGGAFLVLFVGIGLPVLLSPMYSSAGPTARRFQCAYTLKNIGLGLFLYREKFGCLPPPYVPDKTGKPMHSWRVLVLPSIAQDSLYRAYRFDEPWNGPNNSKLAMARDPEFACPGDPTAYSPGIAATNYVAVVGPDTAWSSKHPEKPVDDDHRVLLVEVENSGINWMEPKDLTVDQAITGLTSKSGPRISSGHDPRLANVLLVDGRVAELPTDISPELLRTVLTEDFNRLYKHVSKERIEEMRSDAHPYIGLRLLAWIASIILFLVHGVIYDIREKRRETLKTALAELTSDPNRPS